MDIEKFIDRNHKITLTEDSQGIKIIFSPIVGGLNTESTIWLTPAKRGWNKKPVMYKNQYIITDANTSNLMEFLNKYINLSEDNYHDIRRVIINKAIKIMEDYTNRE
jgi:hypothetical protein